MRHRDTSFAPPVGELHRGFQHPDIAVQPTAGRGFAVNPQGHIPTGTKQGEWTWEFVPSTINPANLAAGHSGQALTATVTGLQVDDLCFWIGSESATGINQCHWFTRPPVCSTAGEITLVQFNTDSSAIDVASATHYFLVVHRFITQ